MITDRQAEQLDAYLDALDAPLRPLYRELTVCLTELGYRPQKDKSSLCFKHTLHNKQLAKLGVRKGKTLRPFFALRFSACRGYSQRFADIVRAAIERNPSKAPRCVEQACSFCAGEPDTHVYTHIFPDGTRGLHCGAYALEIPDLTADDLEELKALMRQEHAYLLAHEAGIAAAE